MERIYKYVNLVDLENVDSWVPGRPTHKEQQAKTAKPFVHGRFRSGSRQVSSGKHENDFTARRKRTMGELKEEIMLSQTFRNICKAINFRGDVIPVYSRELYQRK